MINEQTKMKDKTNFLFCIFHFEFVKALYKNGNTFNEDLRNDLKSRKYFLKSMRQFIHLVNFIINVRKSSYDKWKKSYSFV